MRSANPRRGNKRLAKKVHMRPSFVDLFRVWGFPRLRAIRLRETRRRWRRGRSTNYRRCLFASHRSRRSLEVSTRRDEAATRPRTRTMAASKTELRSRAKGKADAKAKDADAEDTKKDAVAGKTDAQGNLMDAAYYFKQYFGLALSIVAFGMVCFAGYAPKYGLSVNLFLYSSESRVPRVSVSRSNRPQRVSVWLYARASPRGFAPRMLESPTPTRDSDPLRCRVSGLPSLRRRRVRVRRADFPRDPPVQEPVHVRDGQGDGRVRARAGGGGEDSGRPGGEEKGVERRVRVRL